MLYDVVQRCEAGPLTRVACFWYSLEYSARFVLYGDGDGVVGVGLPCPNFPFLFCLHLLLSSLFSSPPCGVFKPRLTPHSLMSFFKWIPEYILQ